MGPEGEDGSARARDDALRNQTGKSVATDEDLSKALARVDPELSHAFAFLGDALTRRPKKKAAAAESAEAMPNTTVTG